jgi:hypothetical protein
MPISDRSAFVSLGAFFMVISLRESVLIQNGMEVLSFFCGGFDGSFGYFLVSSRRGVSICIQCVLDFGGHALGHRKE